MDDHLRELERAANSTGTRETRIVYVSALVRAGHDPLPLFLNLANTYGHPSDIDAYFSILRNRPDEAQAFIAQHTVTIPDQVEPVDPYELDLYFDLDRAVEVINNEIKRYSDQIKRRAWRHHSAPQELPEYQVSQVLRVYWVYYEEEVSDYGIEGADTGFIADVILTDGTETTIWVEEWYAMPDAPDAIPFGVRVLRFDDIRRFRGTAMMLANQIQRIAPDWARAALLPRVEAVYLKKPEEA